MGVLVNQIQLVAPVQNKFSSGEVTAPHTRYGMRVIYEGATGKLFVPVAAPGDPYGGSPRTPGVTVQTHAPYSSVTLEWSAEREGMKPVLPDPQLSGSAGLVLSRWRVVTEPAKLNVDGLTTTFSAHGVYEYVPADGAKPVWAKDALPMGKLPNDSTNAGAYYLNAGDFSAEINPLNSNGQLGRIG